MEILNSPLARKLTAFVKLNDDDLTVLSDLYRRRRKFPARQEIIHQGQRNQAAFILAEGWVCSYKVLRNGNRQIVDFQIPGDFLGLRSVLFRASDHNVEPITKVEASEIVAHDLLDALSKTPRLATAILWAASRDEALVVEHLVSLGRRTAIERTAHLFLELSARLKLVGLGSESGFSCPISQYMLADALGISAVHVNRVMRELREMGLMTFRNHRVELLDVDALIELAEFDRSYLDHEGPLLL